jgi:hypothetical protein
MLQVPPEFRSKREGQRMTLTFGVIIAIGLGGLLILIMTGCSSEAIRQGNKVDLAPMSRDAERNAIRERGQNFCNNYPEDEACRGPKR